MECPATGCGALGRLRILGLVPPVSEAPRRVPLIAVATPLERAQWAVWDMPAAVVARNYLDAIAAAGAVPLLVPPLEIAGREAARALAPADGLMLLGGADVDPATYGAAPHELGEGTDPPRDRIELALLAEARRRRLPVLGICRGMQMINVAAGGTLHQHVPELVGHEEHRRVVGSFDGTEHHVTLAPGSLAAQAAGGETTVVRSHHHQCIASLGEGLRVTGRAEDGVAEAVEGTDGFFVLGVQWHPEADPESGVIARFVQAVREGMDTPAGSSPG